MTDLQKELDRAFACLSAIPVSGDGVEIMAAAREHYYDVNGTPPKGSFTLEELSEYIRQIYYVLLTRAIRGVRVYFEDPAVKQHFMQVAGLK